MESACDAFYDIYKDNGRSDIVKQLIQQLDFHTLSITLLATTAAHNTWDHDRLAREWNTHRAHVLRTDYNESLEATIELSLASPTFRNLGPVAREVLGVVAFFPQGINENNLDWLFPTIPNRTGIFDKLCALSLTYRSNNFITMLAPLRDYLSPQDPRTSPLLCATKDHYLRRLQLLGDLEPDQPGFTESRWIKSEDVNVEHLLNVFATFHTDPGVWDACANFMAHLRRHKPRSTVLGSRVEGLSDDHYSKPQCMFRLSLLFGSLGNHVGKKPLLTRALVLERRQGDGGRVSRTLMELAEVNTMLGLHTEGIQRSREALVICERLGDAVGQAKCWYFLGRSLVGDGQLDAAKEAGSRAIDLFQDQDREYWVCVSHRLLGLIYHSKGQREKAIGHFKAGIGIASPFNWHDQLFWTHFDLGELFYRENQFDNAQSHIEQAKPHAVDDVYKLGRVMDRQAAIWYGQGRLEDAKAESLCALEVFEKLGAVEDLRRPRSRIQEIEVIMERR